MVFSSLLFLFRFLPVVFLVYFLLLGLGRILELKDRQITKINNSFLFLASLVFYAWGEPKYVVLMLFSTVVDYTCGYFTGKYVDRDKKKTARIFVAISMCINLGLLCFFKYRGFFLDNVNHFFGCQIQYKDLPLPIGISFYTFQTMSYTIDVYRKEAPVQKNIISFGSYVVLFPQLIAGPIVRYQTIADQLNHRVHSVEKINYGIRRFMVGLGKKVLLANNIGMLWTTVSAYGGDNLTTFTAWLGVFAFTFQIYFDFSGYSDMAIGLGEMLGFHFLENFNYPYLAESITEFWRRWHISLGTWFKEYVYIPLGGNRKGKARQILNICVVWFLTGMWHGADWNFILWGVYFGVLLIFEKTFFLKVLKKIPAFFRHLYALIFVIGGWAIFAYPDVRHGHEFVKALFGQGRAGFINQNGLYLLSQYAVMFVIVIIASTNLPAKLGKKVIAKEGCLRMVGECLFILLVFLASLAFLVNASYNPFLYFRF